MARRRKKWKRQHRPKFKKFYKFTMQGEFAIKREKLLQKIHGCIAEELFGKMPNYNFGEWAIKAGRIILFIDFEFGMQAEIEGTSDFPFMERLKIHIRLLKLLKRGLCIIKAVNLCLSMYKKQSKNLTSLRSLL